MSKANDATRQEVLGPKLYIETDNPESGTAGPEAWALKGENASNKRVLLAHHDGGLTRFETEERFQVDVANIGLFILVKYSKIHLFKSTLSDYVR